MNWYLSVKNEIVQEAYLNIPDEIIDQLNRFVAKVEIAYACYIW